jgi:hypothetical protein
VFDEIYILFHFNIIYIIPIHVNYLIEILVAMQLLTTGHIFTQVTPENNFLEFGTIQAEHFA